VVTSGGTTIVGMANPPSDMATHASFLYARNVFNLLALLGKEGSVAPDWDDEIVVGTCVLRAGVPQGETAGLLGTVQEPAPAKRDGGGEPEQEGR